MANLGNVKLLKGRWNAQFIEEHRKFKEDETHEHDDQVDAAADAFNELSVPTEAKMTTRITPNPRYAVQYNAFKRDEEEDDDE